MIVGLTNPSKGTIQIGGLDISKEKNEAVKTLGLCPQFDVLYEDLTVEEHLLFYARYVQSSVYSWLVDLMRRLWGYGPGEDVVQVNSILNEIGLYAGMFALSHDRKLNARQGEYGHVVEWWPKASSVNRHCLVRRSCLSHSG
jgi:ABC-type sugar transport system ATPase subunit